MVPVELVDENGDKKTVLRGVEGTYMRVAGIVRRVNVVATHYGDSLEFTGQFRAVDLETGEISDSGKLFLPSVAETYVNNTFQEVSDNTGFGGLEIAFDVGIKPSNSAMGYEYTVMPLIEKKQPDLLDQMLSSLPAIGHVKTE